MYNFIVNPNSRTGNGIKIWRELIPTLKNEEVPYKAYLTKRTGHAAEIAETLTKDGKSHTIVVVGGDGTLNEVINGITNYSRITLGYIPTGSSNDFARGFSLPKQPSKALQMILHPKRHTYMDVGLLEFENKKRAFSVSCGIGFDASICHEALHSKLKNMLNRIGLGKLTYVFLALKQLALFKPAPMTFYIDAVHKVRYEKVYFAAVMNHKCEGGGLRMTPKAVPDDGRLDLCIVEKYAKFVILCLLPTAYKGWHTRFKGVHIHPCRHVSIISDEALPVHADGESCQLQPRISASCDSGKLRIITK